MALFEKKKKAQVDPAPVTKATLTRSIVSSAFILTILSVAVLAYITTAWFSSNRKVDNTGVHMNIQTSPNMFVANAEATDGANSSINGGTFGELNASSSLFTVTFTDPTTPATERLLVPVTHSDAKNTTYGLTYLQNPSIIDRSSGVKTTGDYQLIRTDVLL